MKDFSDNRARIALRTASSSAAARVSRSAAAHKSVNEIDAAANRARALREDTTTGSLVPWALLSQTLLSTVGKNMAGKPNKLIQNAVRHRRWRQRIHYLRRQKPLLLGWYREI